MRLLLLDQGLPRDAAVILREGGLDAVHVSEVGLAAARDVEILARAQREGRVLVTLDADFHAMMMLGARSIPSVVRLRIQGLDGPAAALLIIRSLDRYAAQLSQGCLLTVKARKTTIHLL